MLKFPEVEQVDDKKANVIFNMFNPSHPPAGLEFGKTYKAFTRGFFKKEYYILEITHGDVDDGTYYRVDQWCDKFYKFSSKEDMEMALACFHAHIQAGQAKGKLMRFDVEKENGEAYKEKDYKQFISKMDYSLA